MPHCLFGHVDAAEEYSAARWAAEARAAIAQAHGAGRLPILVGGTGLYLRTLIDGIAPVPRIDAVIRDEVRSLPVDVAYAQLRRDDPAAAARLAPADTTRVARALEVIRATGRPLAAWQAERVGGIGSDMTLLPLILLPDRDWLIARCDRRLEAMLAGGAIDEVRRLIARRDVAPSAPVRRAIGVREFGAVIEGTLTREAALEAAKLATRRYAKRQYTWFRNQPPSAWCRTASLEMREQLAMIERLFL